MKHPALALFERMFREAAAHDSPENSGHLIPRNVFYAQCWKEGIDAPKGVVDGWAWEQKIGLNKLARRLGKLRDSGKLLKKGTP